MEQHTPIFTTKITREQSRDTGMAIVLLLLLAHAFVGSANLLVAAIVLHVVNMTAPQVYRYIAVLWLGVSRLLGVAVSTVVLTLVFLLVVTPVGIVRRRLGIDTLRLRAFRSGHQSVMSERRHTFTRNDVERPY